MKSKNQLRISKKTFAALLSTSILLASCGKETDADKIADAQACLDKSTASNDAAIQACMDKVSAITTAAAEGIRCSGNFMKEGFTDPATISNAFSQIESSGNGNNLMGLITFNEGGSLSADFTNGQNTFSYCYNSGGKGSTMIAAFAYMPIAIHYYLDIADGGGTSCQSPYNLQNCVTMNIALVPAQTELKSIIGNIVIATHRVSCGSSATNQELCSSLQNAITSGGGASNPTGVGNEMITQIFNDF